MHFPRNNYYYFIFFFSRISFFLEKGLLFSTFRERFIYPFEENNNYFFFFFENFFFLRKRFIIFNIQRNIHIPIWAFCFLYLDAFSKKNNNYFLFFFSRISFFLEKGLLFSTFREIYTSLFGLFVFSTWMHFPS
jgi:hypothetical protein